MNITLFLNDRSFIMPVRYELDLMYNWACSEHKKGNKAKAHKIFLAFSKYKKMQFRNYVISMMQKGYIGIGKGKL